MFFLICKGLEGLDCEKQPSVCLEEFVHMCGYNGGSSQVFTYIKGHLFCRLMGSSGLAVLF